MEILFDGYYEGKPSSVRARFMHDNQILGAPEILVENNDQGRMRIDGSGKIATKLFVEIDDPRFDKYRQMWTTELPPLLLSIQKASSYFLACADPEIRKLDMRACAIIGGHIHMATITPKDGFQWVEGYEPKSQ